MTAFQNAVKFFATALAIFLAVCIFAGAVGVFGILGFFTVDYELEPAETTTYNISSNITELDIDIGVTNLTVATADKFAVKGVTEHICVEEKDGVLTITENTRNFKGNEYNNTLILYIPNDLTIKKTNITNGFGKLAIEKLTADVLHLELGTGSVIIDEINVTSKAEIDGGAGSITVNNGTLNNLDLSMGVGPLKLTAALTGNSELDYGVGNTELTLLGSKDTYTLDIDNGVGNVTVEGKKINDETLYGIGENKVSIDCGVGDVSVKFK